MKLLTKYNRTNILATIMVLLAGGFCYYFILHFVLLDQLDNDLKVEEQEIIDYVKANKALPDAANYKDQEVAYESTNLPVKRRISSADIFKEIENEYATNRQLIFPIYIAGKYFKVSISKSQQETEDLIKLIAFITLALVALLLLVLFIINRFVLNKLWHPFNNTLSELKQFNVNTNVPIKLNDSNINEFNELNKALTNMSSRVIKDYEALKSFTENASHEIQTPLAIANSKLELLIQSENFTAMQMNDIQTVHDEINRLSKLNQSLLLLTKIDNQQFQKSEQVDIAKIINKHLGKYEELITAKQISLTKNLDNTVLVLMNEALAEILISNLITNAIKHNIENGYINVALNSGGLIISNTGTVLNSNPVELFERFKKDKVNSESLGLGLSIVKKICEQYNFITDYAFKNEWHILTIRFT